MSVGWSLMVTTSRTREAPNTPARSRMAFRWSELIRRSSGSIAVYAKVTEQNGMMKSSEPGLADGPQRRTTTAKGEERPPPYQQSRRPGGGHVTIRTRLTDRPPSGSPGIFSLEINDLRSLTGYH